MDRRSFFRTLGLGVAAAAGATAIAKAAAPVETRPIMQLGPYLGHGEYAAVPVHLYTSPGGEHTHRLSVPVDSAHRHTFL